MSDPKQEGAGEGDDVSFLRTNDVICLTCVASTKEAGTGGTERVCLAAEGFGNRMCYLENVSDKNVPPDIGNSMFFIDQALSVRALQEMMTAESQKEADGTQNPPPVPDEQAEEKPKVQLSGGGHRTLLYGHAVQLRHVLSEMFLACLSTCSSSDKLAFDVGLQETNSGEACWWTIHPASKQRSEGEKVRVSDDVILVSVATERYLHMAHDQSGAIVLASFHQTLWCVTPVSSGSVRARYTVSGYVFGNDVLRFYHGNDECLTIPENWSEHPQHNMVIYEGGNACNQARSLWRLELARTKWHSALVNWQRAFRVRHITSGRYLGLTPDHQVCLFHKDKADFDSTAFSILDSKDAKKEKEEEKEEEGMGQAVMKYGETPVFVQHKHTNLWFSYQTTEVTKKGVGKVEEKKAVALEEGHMDDCFTFFMAQVEESTSARVIRKCSQVLNRFLKGLEGLQREGRTSFAWRRVDLAEVVKLMEDLIEYFAQPLDELDFEEKQKKLRALRNRQDLFQEEGVLIMILDTIDKFSQMESIPDFGSMIGEENHSNWEDISTYLYLLVAAMIKGNHSNCNQFASTTRLDWLFGRLANPQSAEGILDVLYCVLTESPEALNMITEGHIKSVISLLDKVGRDPKVLDVLSSLCDGNGVAVRSSQNFISNNLLPGKDLLLQTTMTDHVTSMMPNILVGQVEGSSMFKKWYFEAELEHLEHMTSRPAYLRVGWANTAGFIAYPGSGDGWGCNGAGDDYYSWAFDGKRMWTGLKSKSVGVRDLQKGDVIGCSLDLSTPEIRFTLNGNAMEGVFRDFNLDGFFFPVMSLSAKISCRFIFGGDQGRLRYGPPKGFSAIYEAIRGLLEVVPCFSFGDLNKYVFSGPSTIPLEIVPFVPTPIDISNTNLPSHGDAIHEKLAENLHELWALKKIENGWVWGERRSESKRQHPCLTTYDRLPPAEKAYNLNLARDTLKAILALSYHLPLDKPPTRLKTLRLGNNFLMANGYKPAPLDTREIQLDDKAMTLVELLARNTHNVWAKEKINRAWTYGVTEDPIMKRSPHLVPYDLVDDHIKQANRETAGQIIRTIVMYGYAIDPPNVEQDDHMLKENEARKLNTRTYRAESSYAVTSGKWYYEFEILTPGYMKVGWMDVAAAPDTDLGSDDFSYAYDGYLGKKWHQGPEQFGKLWNVGDVVGCFLDLSDKIIFFSLNGEMLLDPSGAEMAFDNFTAGEGFVPAFTLAPGQRAKVNCGQDVNALKYFTTSGLQEGFEPFCVNMYRHLPLWYNKEQAYFENIADEDGRIEVTRIAPSGNNPPALKVTMKSTGTTEKLGLEFLRLSLPVKCNESFIRNKDRDAIMNKLHDLHDENQQYQQTQQQRRYSLSGKDRRASQVANAAGVIRMPTIPKEFGGMDELIDEDGAAGRPYFEPGVEGSTENIVSTDRRPQSGRRSTFSKTQSLEDEPPQVINQLEPPALRVSASETDLEQKRGDIMTVENGMAESDMNGGESRKRGKGLGLFASIGQKMRDKSTSKRRLTDKEEKSGRMKEGRRGRSVDTAQGRRTQVDSDKKRLGMSGSKDILEAPRSGAQRHSLRIRRAGSPRRGDQADQVGSGKQKSGKKVQLPPAVPEVPTSARTGATELAGEDDSYEMMQLAEQIDEYYYGVRIFPGQDPAQVWVGWVSPHFHYHGQAFTANNARKTKFVEFDCRLTVVETTEVRDCYVVNANELLQSIDDQGSASSKVSGLLIGCIVDTSTGELSFLANGKETNNRFRVEPGTMLFPATFLAPTSKDLVQFELGRIKYTFPLSAALFKSARKHLQSLCPPRLRLQNIKPYAWARVPTQTLRGNALKLSETRGWSVLVDDPVRMMAVYVPELDMTTDIHELIENAELMKFHEQTLHLYCALCAHGNFKLAHILCKHVDEEQLMYAIKSHGMAGPLRAGFHDVLIALHLSTHAEARLNTTAEYILPLTKVLKNKNIFFEDDDMYPTVLGQTYSIRPVMAASIAQERFSREIERQLRPPAFNFEALKEHVMEALIDATNRAVMNCRDLIGGSNASHFQPLLKLFDCLYVIGLFSDDNIRQLFTLLDPSLFSPDYMPGTTQKGLMDVQLDEGVKLEVCNILNHLCDNELRHQIESLISFAEGFVGEAQTDQLRRYIEIKQSDMPPAEAAKQTKEFRCPPKEQMLRLLSFKSKDDGVLDEEGELEVCPMSEILQNNLRSFHEMMVKKVRCLGEEEQSSGEVAIDEASWVDKLATFVVPVPPAVVSLGDRAVKNGKKAFRAMIINNIAKWSREALIEDENLIRAMFGLLIRQYNGVAELMQSMQKTYVIHERSVQDVKNFISYLMKVRGLLSVQFESLDEEILKDCLWHLMNNKVFFQHPDLMRILKVNENVMTVMMNVLGRAQGVEQAAGGDANLVPGGSDGEDKPSSDTSEMVVACCKFLCYFCRTSSQNQKAMFEHLPFLLDNATMLLARPSLRGSVPLDVAYSSFMDNNELALALKEDELEKVAIYLSRCGLQPNSELTAKGYPDIGWDPVEGERYIDFLRFAVWVNGETVEENANLVIRLLIRRPECLGPALKGEGQGLFRAFKEAIAMSEEIANMQRGIGVQAAGGVYLGEGPHYPAPEDEGDDYIDMGAAILNFYSSLVELLGKCAPDPATVSAGKGESLRARAILRSLISLEDLESILSLRFVIPNVLAPAQGEGAGEAIGPESTGFLPIHKQAILLFLDRVYGIESQEMFFRLLEQSFLPDLRAATMLDHPSAAESDVALALNRYLCNAVLPLLTNQSYLFAGADNQATLLDSTLHTVYRMSKLRSATNNQRASVSDFLVAITREMKPSMMLKLQRKVVTDIPSLGEYAAVPLRIMTLHYERCGRYYGTGSFYGSASEEEKRLTMILFTSIFDSLGKTAYDPELFNRALPCMIAICSALSPDYTLTSGTDEDDLVKAPSAEDGIWIPKPADVASVSLSNDLQNIAAKFAEHFHDSWASRKFEKGWTHGEIYSRANYTHPRLKPFSHLRDYEKNFYKERCSECVRALLAWGYRIELLDPDAAQRAANAHMANMIDGEYSPRPVDLSNMTLSKEMASAAEKMAENAHQIWAKKTIEDLAAKGAGMLVTLVPWDILTDFERRKNRFRTQEILKFLQYHGYQVTSPSSSRLDLTRANQQEIERSTVEKRFAYALLEKLLLYLDNAAQRLEPVKPSQGFTRRNSFKQSSQDVKFFSKVALPLLQAYFKAHRKYFLQSSVANVSGIASNKEKEMVASLFCRMASLLRRKLHAFGTDAKTTVNCLQVLAQVIDTKTLVKINSDIVRTSLLMFFNNAAEDLASAVRDVRQEGQYASIRGENLKSWTSLEYAHQVLLPVLTTIFNHWAKYNFGQDLIVDELQVAMYKILDSLYSMTLMQPTVSNRKTLREEFEKHRPALGLCASAFASCFPVAFLEPEFNTNNKHSVLAKLQDQSVQAQEMLHSLSTNLPHLDKLISTVEQLSGTLAKYVDHPVLFDVDLPMLCSYLTYWVQYGPDGSHSERQVTKVCSEHMNEVFVAILRFALDHVGLPNAQWLCRLAAFAQSIIPHVSLDPVKDYILPVTEKLRKQTEHAFLQEERIRTHPDEMDEGTVAEAHSVLVRDIYAFFPLLIKYTDQHRAQWLKAPFWDTDAVYENVATIFKMWSQSQHFKREELNFMAQLEDESGGGGELKTGKAAIAERKKKRREGKTKNKEASSVVVACIKRLLPVGLNVFGGRELDIVQQCKEKYLKRELDEKIRDFVRKELEAPERRDPTDKNTWQRNLYHKIGKAQMRGIDTMTRDQVVEKISFMGNVLSILHMVEHPQASTGSAWRKIVSTQRKRAVVACFRMVHLYSIPRHRCINLFLPAYQEKWLVEEDIGQDLLIPDLANENEEEASNQLKLKSEEEEGTEEQRRPDAITQLIQCFQRAATSERITMGIKEDGLYMDYAEVMAKSIHVSEDDGNGGEDDEQPSPVEQEIEKQKLQSEQSRLALRGAADMVLMYLSSCNGEPSDMVAKTLTLGIHLLNGGNSDVQTAMLNYLQEKKDVQFFTSVAGLMSRCSVLNLEMFERQMKAEGLGMGAELASGSNQNLNDVDFTCSLFRFLQLTCEGHNLNFQNYLRNQPGNTTSVNLIICTVDYLLRLQESVMDFYWHYSSKEVVDEAGKQHFLRAIQVCSQVFNTLTESIQGPCVGNQMALANSRLWDAINGFFFLFAHMMDKLSKNSTQLELLREFLGLQKDMIVLMLSMLEGNVLNGSIGKQMVDTLVESQASVELILKFFDMFLKLKNLTTSQAFQEFDANKDGWISPKEFQRAMEAQKMYTTEEINYLLMCTDVNNDGKVDYMEFTERFHNPAKDIGFNFAVLLTNLDEHITNDKRLKKILDTAGNMLEYFDQYLGRIEIMGSSKRVEKVYFQIKGDWLEQWNQPQIKASKKDFLFNVMQDDGGDEGKLESFVNFCEDTIFEMDHATKISSEGQDSRIERAKRQRDIFMGGGEKEASSVTDIIRSGWRGIQTGIGWMFNVVTVDKAKKAQHSAVKRIKSMTYTQLGIHTGKLSAKAVFSIFWLFYFILCTFFRVIYYMMTTRAGGDEEDTVAALPMGSVQGERKLPREPSQQIPVFIPELITDTTGPQYEAFGIKIKADELETTTEAASKLNIAVQPGTPSKISPQGSTETPEPNGQPPFTPGTSDPNADAPQAPPTLDPRFLSPPSPSHFAGPQSPKPSTIYDTGSVMGSVVPPAGPPLSDIDAAEIIGHGVYEPKIAEAAPKAKTSVFHIFAQKYFLIKNATLVLAFIINAILLFYRAYVPEKSGGNGEADANGDAGGVAEAGGDGGGGGDDDEPLEAIVMRENFQFLEAMLFVLSILHCLTSVALLIAYYQLKVPLTVFKREKEVARKLEFEGKWITDTDSKWSEMELRDTWDRMVISSPSFPSNYWDKFVKRKVKEKYVDQCDEKMLDAWLGLDKTTSEEATGFFASIKNTDWRYNLWKMGVIVANGSFQYLVAYVTFSAIGIYSPFFYAGHLIDVVISFSMLQTILKSVTHNGKQLMLTVMMVLVVVYLYTVLAFNFFRKFYVEQEDDGEPDRKCHSMIQCFIFNVYAGVRAGGGIGDELESPYGDENQAWRMIFDLTFHFFVIIILLAIMQGLIIDAFGELRDQQDVAQEKLESNCFICDIGKDYFDKIPRGFERHTEKEHNLANYLFFLMHLINKPDTEFTGQETYVFKLYQKRSWEFIPVGECFLKQYEEQLMAQ